MPETQPTPVPKEQTAPLEPISQDEKIFSAIAYVAFLFVVTLVAKPKSEFCRFHVKQSLVMFITTIVVLMVLLIQNLVGSLLTLSLFALYILAMYRAYVGEMWKIPVLSGFADKINLDALLGKTIVGKALEAVSGLKEKTAGLATKVGETLSQVGKQEEEQPKEEQPKEEQPKEEQPKEEQPKEEQPKKEQPKKEQPPSQQKPSI